MSKRIVFAGTPEFAATHLQALIDHGYDVVGVYTQQDKKAGRGHKMMPTPVKELALAHGIKVYTPTTFKDDQTIDEFKALNADLMIVVAYGMLLPQVVLDIPTLGCINIHGSLLPKLRGAAPIQRALFNGDDQTGITIMQMALKLDAGDMLFKASLNITDDDTSDTLFKRLAILGSELLIEKLPFILAGNVQREKQDESLVTYAKKIEKSEALIDFNQDVFFLDRQVRALNPWPIAIFNFKGVSYKVFKAKGVALKHQYPNGQIVAINKDCIDVACQNGVLKIFTIQAPGKSQVNAGQYASNKKDLFGVGLDLNE